MRRLYISLIVVVVAYAIAHYANLLKYRTLQLKAYAARDLTVNEKIRVGDFYTIVRLVFSREYRYSSPQGMFASSDIATYSFLDSGKIEIQPRSHIMYSPVRIPVVVSNESARVVSRGDEIALSINGRIFPEGNPQIKHFTVLEIIPDDEKESTILLIEVSSTHLSDSLWLKAADAYVIPIIVNHISEPACPVGSKAVWVQDPGSLKGKYECRTVVRKKAKAKKCPCEASVPS